MILGVGIDLVSVERISKIYAKYPDRFLDRIFTSREQARFAEKGSPVNTLASRFAAKEAVLKAIGCGIGPAALKEVEVIETPGKQPTVRLHGCALKEAEKRLINAIALSIAHEPPFACACAAVFNSSDGCN